MIQADKPWDKQLQTLLALVVAINILPHGFSNPTWATIVGAGCVLWKLLYLNRGLGLPNRYLLGLGAVAATSATWVEYGTLFGTEAASCLLVVLASLKLLETNRYRDAMLVIFTSYFLLMAHLLSSQSLLSTIFMAFDILIITTLMFHLHKRDRRKSIRSFRPAMRMLSLTLPVWILFFFVFPRFTAAFWDAKPAGAGTGFSEDLNPGSIEQLVQSDEPAFRVLFRTARKPNPESLYWRGGVLSIGDGIKWSKRAADETARLEFVEPAEPPQTEYEVFLEPGFQKWLFVLEYVKRFRAGDWLAGRGIRGTNVFTYHAAQRFQTRVSYSAIASREAPLQTLVEKDLEVNLQVPEEIPERMERLARQIASAPAPKDVTRAEELANRVMEHFRKENFRYTLRPGPLTAATGAGQLDQFLFERKLGFCEHYAAAFATLMRLMKVPARVVVGFQGGRYNEFGDYLLVRHLDAHAWTEIWVDEPSSTPGSGRWKRFDPTNTIAPLRLQLGGDFNRLDPQDISAGLSSEELRTKMNGGLYRFTLRATLAWDALQMRWNAFLLDYDLSYQLELLGKLGFKNASVLLLFIGLAVGLGLFATIAIYILRRRSKKPDPVLRLWEKFCRTCERGGITRRMNEGPLAFTERAASLRPRSAAEILRIGRHYMELRYGNVSPSDQSTRLADLKDHVRRFSVPASDPSSRDATS